MGKLIVSICDACGKRVEGERIWSPHDWFEVKAIAKPCREDEPGPLNALVCDKCIEKIFKRDAP